MRRRTRISRLDTDAWREAAKAAPTLPPEGRQLSAPLFIDSPLESAERA